jgi:hypothetical protein
MAFFKGLENKKLDRAEKKHLKEVKADLKKHATRKKGRAAVRVRQNVRGMKQVGSKVAHQGGYVFSGLTGVGASKKATKIRMKRAKARKSVLRKQLRKLI